MAKCEKILIAGFSGAGKSSLLRALESEAPNSHWTFSDLDQLVLRNHKSHSIAQLVENLGWEKFRLWERQSLEGWLKDEGKGILALGGGALSQIILDLYGPTKKIKFCYLHAPFEKCWERLVKDHEEERPLLKRGQSELHEIYLERQKLFSQIPWKLDNSKDEGLGQLAKEFWRQLSLG